MMRAGRHWNPNELYRVQRMKRQGKSIEDIARQMGRTVKAVKTRLKRGEWRMSGNDRFDHIVPCPIALQERELRITVEPRDVTAALMGDPLPGRSALERDS